MTTAKEERESRKWCVECQSGLGGGRVEAVGKVIVIGLQK